MVDDNAVPADKEGGRGQRRRRRPRQAPGSGESGGSTGTQSGSAGTARGRDGRSGQTAVSGGRGPRRDRGPQAQGQGRGRPRQDSRPRADGPPRDVAGLLEVRRDSAGILRNNALAGREDAIVSAAIIREVGLRPGDLVAGVARGQALVTISTVNGNEPVGLKGRRRFEDLTAIHPQRALVLGPTPDAITGRLLDLVAPVGLGQRGLIVAPPKAGKTTLLKDMAKGIARDPEVELIAILVAERPEEATDLRRSIDGTVLAADLDMPGEDHIRVAVLGVEYAKRLVEEGRNVVVLIDSLTRLARAYNLTIQGTGRSLSGGIDAGAIQPVRQIFGSARCAEEGGSLTILATCLVDTGSRLDDLVYEEFKGTGNMEVHLDRELAQKRLFPAININRSGTRREELLLDPETYQRIISIRRKLAGVAADEALGAMLQALQRQIIRDGTIAGSAPIDDD